MTINPDKIIVIKTGPIEINSTIFFTWIVMAVLIIISFIATRKLSSGTKISRMQNILESIVEIINNQIKGITGVSYAFYFPFLATMFLFILTCNILVILPLYHPPTSSFSTTAALAFSVFIAVPFFGIVKLGFFSHMKSYLEPTFIMLPFNILSEISRTIAMSVRLFGNVMSESLIGAILLLIVPFFVPVVLKVLGLIIGVIQAYIFFILSSVYIGASTQAPLEIKFKKN